MKNEFTGEYSNGDKSFHVSDLNKEYYSISSETGVPFLRLKSKEIGNIGKDILKNFMTDELTDFKQIK